MGSGPLFGWDGCQRLDHGELLLEEYPEQGEVPSLRDGYKGNT